MDFSQPQSPAIGAVITGKEPITSMSYHEGGQRLFAASEADSRLRVIDCAAGRAARPALRCEREHLRVVAATHHDQAVLFAGKGSPTQPAGQRHAVNYWSVYDNKILRKFKGHSDAVTTISMCPADDTFLTSSADGTVRLWTLQQAGCVAEMKLPAEAATGTPVSVFDSTGLVFAIAAAMADDSKEAGHYLHLYDARNYAAGAFAELKVAREDLEKAIQSHAAATISQERAAELSRADWASMQFNASGNQILVGAGQGMSIVLDGFEGTVQRVLVDRPSSASSCCCFTSDDKTVLQGNDDGSITCWSVESGTVVKRLEGHPGPVTCVAANPMYTQIASACANTALWTW